MTGPLKMVGKMLCAAEDWLAKSSLSPDMQAWVTGMDTPDDNQGAKLTSPYMQSAWVYVAVSVLAENLSQIPFRISRVSSGNEKRVRAWRGSSNPKQRAFCRRELGENLVESGDVVDLFECPHPTMGKTLFWEMVVTWDCLRGEFFILPLDEADGVVDLAERSPKVRRMLTLPTELFWHMVVGYELQAWRYTGSPLLTPIPSEMLLPSEVIHSRSPNPYLYWRGMSPLLVAMLPASADYAAEMFQKGLLVNNADTGIIATTDQNLTEEQREMFTAALRERKRKAGTPDRPLFLSSGIKIEKPTISNVDMQFLETRRLLRQEIGAIFKVPESLMGFSEAKSSALSGGGNALNEEKLTFIEQTLQPKCNRLEAAVQPIIDTFGDGLVGWFDIESLPIMQMARRARVDTATKVFSMGVPFNVANQVYDLGFPEMPWGDKGYLPFSLQPADAVEEPMPGEAPDGKPEPDADDEGQTGFQRMRNLLGGIQSEPQTRGRNTKALWEHHVRQRRRHVKLLEGKVRKLLHRYREKTLQRLSAAHLEKTAEQNLQASFGTTRGLVDIIFSASEFGAALKSDVTEPIRSTLGSAVSDLISEVGADPWEMPPAKATEYIHGRSQPIMDVGGTVRAQLNTALEEGIKEGESTADLAKRVKGVFTSLAESEAERVARTEINMAFNFARQEAMVGVGIDYKAWLSSHGPNVREAHEAAEEFYIDDPIPVDEPFIVAGEELMFPGDDSGSAGNVINCQCVSIAAQKEDKGWKFFGLGLNAQT